jgi:hypothetical protein
MSRRLGFERCYELDDGEGPTPRPGFLSPVGLVAAALAVVMLFAVLLATPFWHATAPRPAASEPAAVRSGA